MRATEILAYFSKTQVNVNGKKQVSLKTLKVTNAGRGYENIQCQSYFYIMTFVNILQAEPEPVCPLDFHLIPLSYLCMMIKPTEQLYRRISFKRTKYIPVVHHKEKQEKSRA